jgi:hypothetical protein
MATKRGSLTLSLLFLALSWPVTGFLLLPGLGRPPWGHGRCSVAARRLCPPHGDPVLARSERRDKEKQNFGLALMDPPPTAGVPHDAAKNEFELNRGLAVDTLLHDYPTIFSQSCDLSIFHENILLRDTQGFSLEGIRSYRVRCLVLSRIMLHHVTWVASPFNAKQTFCKSSFSFSL